MSNQYKSIGIKVTTVNNTTLYTCPVATKSLIRSIYCSNISEAQTSVDVYVQKNNSVDNIYIIKNSLVPIQSSFQPITEPIILEAGDEIFVKSSVENSIDVLCSFVEFN